MITVLVGLSAALLFGFADFIGGIASKRISAIRVTGIVAISGLIALFAAMPFLGGEWSWEAVLYGGLSGVTGAGAIVLLYACLAIGPMSILSPLTALMAAFVPLTAQKPHCERNERRHQSGQWRQDAHGPDREARVQQHNRTGACDAGEPAV